nr:uncharacterized protein LOC133617301 isoform X3 [Nerophis lumbriciformis]
MNLAFSSGDLMDESGFGGVGALVPVKGTLNAPGSIHPSISYRLYPLGSRGALEPISATIERKAGYTRGDAFSGVMNLAFSSGNLMDESGFGGSQENGVGALVPLKGTLNAPGSIHPSIFYRLFPLGSLETISATIGRKAGYTLDKSPPHRRANTDRQTTFTLTFTH